MEKLIKAKNSSLDLVYFHYIKPLSYNDRVLIVQRILKDFIIEQKNVTSLKVHKLKNLERFKGIASLNDLVINEEDWYKQ